MKKTSNKPLPENTVSREPYQAHKVITNQQSGISKPVPVTELTPELADKIWNQIQAKRNRQQIAKEEVLHHLKQLKAQMGKMKKWSDKESGVWKMAIQECMNAVDKKIAKINKQ